MSLNDVNEKTQESSQLPIDVAPQRKEKVHPLEEFFGNGETILNQLKIETLATILFRKDVSPINRCEKRLLDDYKKRMGFYITSLFDPMFDVFTIPPPSPSRSAGIPNPQEVSVFFEFYESQFKMTAKVEKSIANLDVGYELNIVPILECLETGIITKDLFKLLEKMKVNSWDNGSIIVKCADHRLQPTKEFVKKLTAGKDLIDYHANILLASTTASQQPIEKRLGVPYEEKPIDPRQKLEFEQQALLIQNPTICTDPSPDIARIYSVIDFRKKMWDNMNAPDRNTMTRRETVKPQTKIQIARIDPQKPLLNFPNNIDNNNNNNNNDNDNNNNNDDNENNDNNNNVSGNINEYSDRLKDIFGNYQI